MVLCGRLPTFVCFLEFCRLCIFGFTSNNFIQNTKNLSGDDHNQEMKIFNFGFSILVKTKVFVAFVIAYSNQVLHVKKNPNIVVYSRFLVMQLQMKKAILSICFKTYFKMNLIYLLFHRRRDRYYRRTLLADFIAKLLFYRQLPYDSPRVLPSVSNLLNSS